MRPLTWFWWKQLTKHNPELFLRQGLLKNINSKYKYTWKLLYIYILNEISVFILYFASALFSFPGKLLFIPQIPSWVAISARLSFFQIVCSSLCAYPHYFPLSLLLLCCTTLLLFLGKSVFPTRLKDTAEQSIASTLVHSILYVLARRDLKHQSLTEWA